MKREIIDAHIHLDMYSESEQDLILKDLTSSQLTAMISVSNDFPSCQRNLSLHKKHSMIKPAFGYHPEQGLPTQENLQNILEFMTAYRKQMVAVGEVGLPYYLKRQDDKFNQKPYIELLEIFIQKAVELDKPIILHAIYEDADIVCDLLEKYKCESAHFHWFKGSRASLDRLQKHGYYISITPDLLYEKEIQDIVACFPLEQMMVETDGPWPFDGVFKNQMTHPKMIHQTIDKISKLKAVDLDHVYQVLKENTERFYQI